MPEGLPLATIMDAILVLVLVEAVVLVLVYRQTGQGLPPRKALATLAAGFFMALALRLALGTGKELAILGCLLASLLAHVMDLSGRWRRG